MQTPKFKTSIGQALWEVHSPSYPDRLVPTASLASILRLSKPTLATMRSRGGGPEFLRIRGRVFYDLATAIQWIEENMEVHQ
jgi:phage terminase Nu1 subunit (DNA packaging protein)